MLYQAVDSGREEGCRANARGETATSLPGKSGAAGGVRSPYSEVSGRWKILACELAKIVRQTRRDESRRGRHECLRHESDLPLDRGGRPRPPTNGPAAGRG